jgi:type II secretory pathway pseudopilin PulG
VSGHCIGVLHPLRARNGSLPAMQRCSGFTYVGLLILVALLGIGLAAVGEIWSTMAQRERERELLFIGAQVRRAIGDYYQSSPGIKHYPRRLEDLLEDKRGPVLRRHLRKIYVDPMTGKPDWAFVIQGDQILGIHSSSRDQPLKVANFRLADSFFAEGLSYSDWRFVYTPAGSPSAGVAALAADMQVAPASPALAALSSIPDRPAAGARPEAETMMDVAGEDWVCIAGRANDMRACGEPSKARGAEDCRQSAAQRYRSCLGAAVRAGSYFPAR